MGARSTALAVRIGLASAVALSSFGTPQEAFAGDPTSSSPVSSSAAPRGAPDSSGDHDDQAFPLAVHHDKHYLKATLEIFGVLGVGFVDYLLNTTARGGTLRQGEVRWRLRYDWPTFREKLIGTGLDLDANAIGTNYVSHPLAGTLYFTAARSNHLSFAEAFAFAVGGSTTWEYFGEIREQTSINDMIVTPVSGAVIGETLMQLSGFFRRGDKNVSNGVAAFVFSPIKTVNDWTDDAVTVRSASTDVVGLPREPWHRFTLAGGGGFTIQDAAGNGRPSRAYADQRVGLDMRLANLRGYGGAARRSRLFDDGNVAALEMNLGFSEGNLVDGLFATRLVPVGYFVRDAVALRAGGVRGQGAYVGLRMAFEYSLHDYDRDRSRPKDLVAMASPVGVAAEYTFERGAIEVKTGLDIGGAISAVAPYGYTSYKTTRAIDDVLTPVRNRGYYHALAFTVVPTVEIAFHGLRWTTRLRLDTFRGIVGADENESQVANGPRFSDRRSRISTTLAWVPQGTPLRVAVDVGRSVRAGEVGPAFDSRSETSASGSLGLVF